MSPYLLLARFPAIAENMNQRHLYKIVAWLLFSPSTLLAGQINTGGHFPGTFKNPVSLTVPGFSLLPLGWLDVARENRSVPALLRPLSRNLGAPGIGLSYGMWTTNKKEIQGLFIQNPSAERLYQTVAAIGRAHSGEDVDTQIINLYVPTTGRQESTIEAVYDLGQDNGAARSELAGRIRPFDGTKSPQAPETLAAPSGLPIPTTAPSVLYHWVSFDVLKRWANDIEKMGHFILRRIYGGTLLALHYPDLVDTPGLFTWIHPLLGMGCNAKEIYGKGEAVVRLDINPKATVKTLETQNGVKPPSIDLRGVDLIYHRRTYPLANGSYGVDWQEWVVVNPAAVLRFTADPRIISSEIQMRIRESERYFDRKSGMYDFPVDQLHVSSFLFSMENMFRKIVIARAQNFIHLNKDLIPKMFLGSTPSTAK